MKIAGKQWYRLNNVETLFKSEYQVILSILIDLNLKLHQYITYYVVYKYGLKTKTASYLEASILDQYMFNGEKVKVLFWIHGD